MNVRPRIHGKAGSYKWCRDDNGRACATCREAHSQYNQAYNRARAQRLKEDPSLAVHGRRGTYDAWGCRCPLCCAVASAVNRRSYARRMWERAGYIYPTTAPPDFTPPFGREWLQP